MGNWKKWSAALLFIGVILLIFGIIYQSVVLDTLGVFLLAAGYAFRSRRT